MKYCRFYPQVFTFFLCFLNQFLLAIEPSAPVLIMVGTRPEAIKLYSVYTSLKNENIPTLWCSTGQHTQMVEDVCHLLGIHPDYEFKIMKPNQDLFYITESILAKTKELINAVKPSMIVVQGDTTTAFAAALAAFYLRVPIAHVEAGLRTGNIYAPFPEELNRKWISTIASYHFAPTIQAVKNLENEGINTSKIFCTGNTVVDTLYAVNEKIKINEFSPSSNLSNLIDDIRTRKQKIFLLTAHRRESLENGFHNIFSAIKSTLEKHPEIHFIYPMHPNPLIKKIADEVGLQTSSNIDILPPLSYQDMVYLLDSADVVVTDSGGIQEEAISLNKSTLILRNETDRPEGVSEGLAILAGTDRYMIEESIDKILENMLSGNVSSKVSPYGDGKASLRIAKIIKSVLEENESLEKIDIK